MAPIFAFHALDIDKLVYFYLLLLIMKIDKIQ